MLHEWIKSDLGHGEAMCKNCKMTNREAAVLGKLNDCDFEPQYGFDELGKTILAYNEVLRSAMLIAERKGKETNWKEFRTRVAEVLEANHPVFVFVLKARKKRLEEEAAKKV